jgi:hypothetical protein
MDRIFFKTILVLVLLGVIAGLGVFAYRAGFSQGAAQSAQLSAGEAPALVYPYYGMWYGWPFYGVIMCLAPLFLMFLAFIALRGLFWHGRGGWRRMHYGPWDRRDWKEGVPPPVEEWHRKMHQGENSWTSSPADSQASAQARPEQV